MRTVAFATLGCKLNQYETELIREHFEEAGYRVVPFSQHADLYLVNTCTVTGRADRQSRNLIRRAANLSPTSRIIATGCYARIAPQELATLHPAVTVVDNSEKISHIQSLLQVKLDHIQKFSGHTRAFIKVVDGCDRFCSYCVIPYARSKVQSRPASSIELEARQLVENGYKEIILTGVNIGSYGEDTGTSLIALLERLEGIPSLRRLRLSSIEPEDTTDELIGFMAESGRLCHHLHIPLQSGDDEILNSMGRKYTSEGYRILAEKALRKIPDFALGTDLIVGFPGETHRQFQNTRRMIEELPLSYLHVFRYSPRKGTKASQLPGRVDEEVKRERSRVLIEIGREKSYQFRRGYLGKTLEALVESRRSRGGLLTALSGNYVKVLFDGLDALHNQLVRLRITGVTPSETHGEREGLTAKL